MTKGLCKGLGKMVLGLCVCAAIAAAQEWKATSVHQLRDVRLGEFLKDKMKLDVDDHGIRLGGIGSGLWRSPLDDKNVFWMITDRGPNAQIVVSGATRRTFPIPQFSPLILKVKASKQGLKVLEVIPITGTGPVETGITGLSNNTRDEVPYGCNAVDLLTYNTHGLDTEDLVRTVDGTFYVVDEYSPSIVKISSTGKMLNRWVPANMAPPLVTSGYPVTPILPEIFGKRKANRGFEGLTMSPDQKLIYAALQSPLLNPTTAIGNASRNTRILAMDTRMETPVAEYVYRFQPVTEFGDTNLTEMKVSALAMIDDYMMLVLERTDKVAKLYRVDLSTGTNILNSKWDNAATTPTLEALDDDGLATNQVKPLAKELILTMDSAKGWPGKIEGLTLVDMKTIAIANDNDFGIGDFEITPSSCTLKDSGVGNSLIVVRLNRALDK